MINNEKIEGLVLKYLENQDIETRNEIMVECMPLVKYISYRVSKAFCGAIAPEDLEAAGHVGVIKALDAFDINKETAFCTYVTTRIDGNMRDEVRKLSSVPRQFCDYFKKVDALSQKLERDATEEDIITELQVPERTAKRIIRIKELSNLEYLDSFTDNQADAAKIALTKKVMPEETLLRNIYLNEIYEAMETLQGKRKDVIKGIYFDNKTTLAISKELGVSEGRVSQLHTTALKMMREFLIKKNSVDVNFFFAEN